MHEKPQLSVTFRLSRVCKRERGTSDRDVQELNRGKNQFQKKRSFDENRKHRLTRDIHAAVCSRSRKFEYRKSVGTSASPAPLPSREVVRKSHCYINFRTTDQKIAANSIDAPLLMFTLHYLKNSEEAKQEKFKSCKDIAADSYVTVVQEFSSPPNITRAEPDALLDSILAYKYGSLHAALRFSV
ncbi:hypothetical protein EVAR_34282_1 [Eumeta japonica]|uniref:Uncharacterized protein n=1 Tax=Eumeta variegata TaxID=151549 RepID=A0A4C1VVV3_EUMVA|nr:hypothetical protein EVAR_34282_1 [Eumeta japonica]